MTILYKDSDIAEFFDISLDEARDMIEAHRDKPPPLKPLDDVIAMFPCSISTIAAQYNLNKELTILDFLSFIKDITNHGVGIVKNVDYWEIDGNKNDAVLSLQCGVLFISQKIDPSLSDMMIDRMFDDGRVDELSEMVESHFGKSIDDIANTRILNESAYTLKH